MPPSHSLSTQIREPVQSIPPQQHGLQNFSEHPGCSIPRRFRLNAASRKPPQPRVTMLCITWAPTAYHCYLVTFINADTSMARLGLLLRRRTIPCARLCIAWLRTSQIRGK